MKKAPLGGALAALVAVISCIGCTGGRRFSRPEPDSLVLGVTTCSEVRERLGAPLREGTSTANGVKVKFLHYGYAQQVAEDLVTWGYRVRHLTLNFVDERLVAFEGRSSFQEDSTDFDASKLSELKDGVTTRAQAVELLGPPPGLARYPILPGKDEEALVYGYLYLTRPDRGTVNKRLVVVLGPDGVVRRSDSRLAGPEPGGP